MVLAIVLKRRVGRLMTPRLRHCVECPKCRTRYLVGFSPYPNGTYLVPLNTEFQDEWLLHCSCARPLVCSRWRWSDLQKYDVSSQAHVRGYGTPEEIVRFGNRPRSRAESGRLNIGSVRSDGLL